MSPVLRKQSSSRLVISGSGPVPPSGRKPAANAQVRRPSSGCSGMVLQQLVQVVGHEHTVGVEGPAQVVEGVPVRVHRAELIGPLGVLLAPVWAAANRQEQGLQIGE